jgi:AraC family transcriptional regulator, transcriptional activator of the genes for pyochelin and ferripyochelin receptors
MSLATGRSPLRSGNCYFKKTAIMTLILTQQDLCDLWDESELNGTAFCYEDDFEFAWKGNLPKYGSHCGWDIELREGLGISIQDNETIEDLIFTPAEENDTSWWGLAFFLVGKVKTILHGLTDEIDELVGHNYLCCEIGTKETESWKWGQFHRVYLRIDPKVFFAGLTETQLADFPSEIRQAVICDRPQPYYRQGRTTLEMQQVIHQILCCPFQGLMKRIYLEAKALELITLQFAQFQEQNSRQDSLPKIKNCDRDRLYQAKEILINTLENPPSLQELAKRVGMSDFQLKRGFRQVFGTTAFKYLHDYRLEQARKLLLEGEMSVEKVIYQVGFTSRSYFAKVFRQKFGINPSKILKKNSNFF